MHNSTSLILNSRISIGFPGIEDYENWHGKPLGDKAAEIVKALQNGLHSANRMPIELAKPTATVPNVNLNNVRLSEPPNYKLGEKVIFRFILNIRVRHLF